MGALLSDYRIVIKGGSMMQVLHTDESERVCSVGVSRLDEVLSQLRDRIRHGERLTSENIQSQEKALEVAQRRFAEKVITKLDLLQVRDNVAQSRAMLPDVQHKARLANNALCVLLGLPARDLTAEPLVGEGPVPVVPSPKSHV